MLALCLHKVLAIPESLAIVFGSESVGCSDTMLEAADKRVYLPLHGFADSLNLSVSVVRPPNAIGRCRAMFCCAPCRAVPCRAAIVTPCPR